MKTGCALAVMFCVVALTLPSLDAAQDAISSRKLMGTLSSGDLKDGGKLTENDAAGVISGSQKTRDLKMFASGVGFGDADANGDNPVTRVTTSSAAAVTPEAAIAASVTDAIAAADSGSASSSAFSSATAGGR